MRTLTAAAAAEERQEPGTEALGGPIQSALAADELPRGLPERAAAGRVADEPGQRLREA